MKVKIFNMNKPKPKSKRPGIFSFLRRKAPIKKQQETYLNKLQMVHYFI